MRGKCVKKEGEIEFGINKIKKERKRERNKEIKK